jgi:hypothetical protein
MDDSVQMGRPYRTQTMTPIELLASLWSATQLGVRTRRRLAVPLWLIWGMHTLRITWQYFSYLRANEKTLNDIKLVSDYMLNFQHTGDGASTVTMSGYRYIVTGEKEDMMSAEPPNFTTLCMKPEEGHDAAELLTLDKVWEQAQDDDRLKDVCLSFALYKLQCRRFYNFPISEATHPATRRLVADAILEEATEDGGGYERALRITEAELSFLHDFFYCRHAAVFAYGFPHWKLLESLLMTAAASYLSYAVGDIPGSGTVVTGKKKDARITHGVLFTRCIIGIIVCRELVEAGIYVLSQWAKVWIVCCYIKLKREKKQRRLRIVEKLGRILFPVITRGRWDRKIRQYNLLMSAQTRPFIIRKVQLQSEVKTAVFKTLKDVIMDALASSSTAPPAQQRDANELLTSYFQRAFPAVVDNTADERTSPQLQRFMDPASKLEGDTHKILVWHVATGICQIKLLEQAGRGDDDLYTLPIQFGGDLAAVSKHYVTTVSLSNYCAYLVTQRLVPDNGLVVNKVLDAVRSEVAGSVFQSSNMAWIYNRFVTPASRPVSSILGIGVELSETLMSEYEWEQLWEHLAKFWAGFLLYLSASTRAAKHRIHLEGRGELTTHLWVLLSHAGFLGKTSHGEQMLDQIDLRDV